MAINQVMSLILLLVHHTVDKKIFKSANLAFFVLAKLALLVYRFCICKTSRGDGMFKGRNSSPASLKTGFTQRVRGNNLDHLHVLYLVISFWQVYPQGRFRLCS